jgi:hypothetical protein
MFSFSYRHMHHVSSQRGFVILFAVLVSSILLSIGLGIFSITYKELLLSSSDRDSQVAFYAADTGTECALYWDVQHPDTEESIFGLVLAATSTPPDASMPALCAGKDIVSDWAIEYYPEYLFVETTFTIDTIGDTDACAEVSVTKSYDALNNERTTQIDSRGFNSCAEGISRRVERGLRVEYSL